MRVLITRPEREGAALAVALAERGHLAVLAPLFALQMLRPPAEFAAALASCQAVLLTSANGARALAEASEQRSKPVVAVGDTTATTAEGLGFTSVTSASGDGTALAELVRQRLDPKAGPLIHVTGVNVAGDLALDGFEVHRLALYEAREMPALPDSARAALGARALDAATFFSARASTVFVKLVEQAGLSDACRSVSAVAISPTAARPLQALPFKATIAAARPTRQAVLDEIDRLGEAVVQGHDPMSETTPAASEPPAAPPPVIVRRGLGVVGAFVVAMVAAMIVVAAAVLSLPYWPEEARVLWRGAAPVAPKPAAAPDIAGPIDAAKRELGARIDDLERRMRALPTTSAAPSRPAGPDAAIADLRARLEALENKPAPVPAPAPAPSTTPAPAPAASAEVEKEVSALRSEIASLRGALTALDQAVAGQKDAIEKARNDANARTAVDQKALQAARASAVIAIAARLSAALESGLPFAQDLTLLTPLAQGDAKLGEAMAGLQPLAAAGVPSRAALAADFPNVAKAALADDLADDSFGERLLGKLRSVVSLRRVGADVQGDSVEARLARAEAAIDAGDIAKAAELVKALPEQTRRATATWLARAETHLAAQRAVDQLAAHAVSLLGAAR
jgi:uroporphyrinogen-III synthase